jgi:hypothetical protein
MDDGIGLFKLLVVLGIVGYQIVKALRKKSAEARSREESTGPATEPESPSDDDTWKPEPVRSAPLPAPIGREAESVRERIRTLILGRESALESAAPAAPKPTPVAAAETPMAAPVSVPERNLVPPAKAPAIRDMILSQVVLAPPPGLRGTRWARRSGAFRP